MSSLGTKVFKEKVFATDGIEYVRTVPMDGEDAPFIGYIKTTKGEAKVSYDNGTLTEVLVNGKEISEQEYLKTKLTVVNSIVI